MDLEKFRDDVYNITEKLSSKLNEQSSPKLSYVREVLIELYQKNLVKINHSVLELIVASNLISKGYSVDVEKKISDILICDIFAQNGNKNEIVEIETGFTPPEHALDTVDYYSGRIMSKIARYSKYCTKFSLATPVIGILPIPKLFLTNPKNRTKNEVEVIQAHCNRFYKNPPINFEDIRNARLDSVYLIHIDKGIAKELTPSEYIDLTENVLRKSEINSF